MRKIAATDPYVTRYATMPSAGQARPAVEEEDNEGDVEVQEIEDQGEVRPDSPSEAEEGGVARPLHFGGYNEVGEPVSEAGDVLEEGDDYVTEKYIEAVPQRRQGAFRARRVSPLSIVTQSQLRSLETDGYLGDVECFFPSPNHRATSPREGFCAWSGAHTK
uniref:Uncharacterized protein n=1 Tax=Cannabis sativa TaxID=3483 RepID=A0A803PB36_CANSA